MLSCLSAPSSCVFCIRLAGRFVRALKFSAWLFVLFTLGVPIPSEHLATAHVVVSVASTVGVVLKRGVVRMIHERLPPLELSAYVAALCGPTFVYARPKKRARDPKKRARRSRSGRRGRLVF